MQQPPHLISEHLSSAPHGFFGRAGGVSAGLFSTLNVGPGSSDKKENVQENRARCARSIGADPGQLVTLYQIHSSTVVIADKPWPMGDGAPQADAIVTKSPGIAIGILTADCMPFLFADADAGVIGAAHAGWRGALGGVLENTVQKMQSLGATPSSIKATLGPCLRRENFEVGLELVDAFMKKTPIAEQFFSPGVNEQKRQFDLAAYGRWCLSESGVNQLDDFGLCTLGEKENYFSYRASRRAQEPDYGRNLSVIMLPDII